MTLYYKTPLLESRRLREDCSVWLKLENTQPSGSFKNRGIGYACEQYKKKGAKHFVSSSGGNAGLAVAYSGRVLNVPTTVFVPETTTETAKNLIRSESAEVVVHGASWAEAHQEATKRAGKDAAYIHPFDDPLIWQGHSSIVDELSTQRDKPEAIVLSVGGGGLFTGVVQGLQRVGWSDVKVLAVETEGADSLRHALLAGELSALDSIKSIATSLGAKQVAAEAFKLAQTHPTDSFLVSDSAAVRACRILLDMHHILVEPACGASVSAALETKYKDIVVIVCGGVGVSDSLLRDWEKSFL